MFGNQKEPRRSILVEPNQASPAYMSPEDAEDAAYLNQLQKEQAAIEQRNAAREARDQISYLLNATYYVKDKSWGNAQTPWKMPLRVSRFYPEIDVAVDIVRLLGPDQRKEAEWKKSILEARGIRYGILDFTNEPQDLIPQLGIPRRRTA